MERPRRHAAVAALEKIRKVRDWETMPESSKRFREVAAQIEAEFHAEERGQHVRVEDIDPPESECESSDAEYCDSNESFVSEDDDWPSEDADYEPAEEELELRAGEAGEAEAGEAQTVEAEAGAGEEGAGEAGEEGAGEAGEAEGGWKRQETEWEGL